MLFRSGRRVAARRRAARSPHDILRMILAVRPRTFSRGQRLYALERDGDAVLVHSLGGGIVAKLADTLQQSEAFMSGFTSKGKLSHVVEKIPVRLILNDQAALLGTIRYALDQGS